MPLTTLSAPRQVLLACACCRHIWRWITDSRSRAAVEVVERNLDGVPPGALKGAHRAAGMAVDDATSCDPLTLEAAWAAYRTIDAAGRRSDRETEWVLRRVIHHTSRVLDLAGAPPLDVEWMVADLTPHDGVPVDPAWLRWRDGVVAQMVRAIHEEWRFDELPILADALEEAGCDNADLLAHCRQPGPHSRGCWAVDALRKKL
jgi:hypothetical protein